jgi:hypothetical protein
MAPQQAAHLHLEIAGKYLDAIQKSLLLVIESQHLFSGMGLIKGDLRGQWIQLLID